MYVELDERHDGVQHLIYQALIIRNLSPQTPVFYCQLYDPILYGYRSLCSLYFMRHGVESCCHSPKRADLVVNQCG